MKLNIPLFQKIRDRIAAEPDRFDMTQYVTMSDAAEIPDDLASVPTACGTAMCIAGWAAVLSPRAHGAKPIRQQMLPGRLFLPDELGHFKEFAAQELGIDDLDLAHTLFHANAWPLPYVGMSDYDGALTILDRIIATGDLSFIEYVEDEVG